VKLPEKVTAMRTDLINKATETDRDYYLVILDSNGRIHFANSHLISNLGLNWEKIPDQNFTDFLEPGHRQYFHDTLKAVEKSSNMAVAEVAVRNGSMHWIKWEITPFQNETGITGKYMCVGYDIVEKGRVRKMKLVAEKNYQAIVEGLSTGIVMQDNNSEVLAANQKAAEIFGISIETIYDCCVFKDLWQNIFIDDIRVKYENCPWIKAMNTATAQNNVVITLQTPGGEIKSLLVNSQPLFEENNPTPISVVSSFIDISKEKELEEEVSRRDILFSTFMDNTPNLTWIVDEDARLVYGNRSFFKYLALDKNALNRNILELVPTILADALHKKHLMVLESGLPQKTQEKMFLADGTEIGFLINLFPVGEVEGRRLLGGEAINITNRLKTERQLQNVNERLFHLSRITTDAIWEWDMHSGTIFRNQILQDLIGFSQNRSQNLVWWFRRVHPGDRRRVRDVIKKVLKNEGQHWECEYRFKKAEGEYIIVYDRGYIIYENNRPVKMIGSLQDVTHVKELEEKLIQEKIQRQKDITETIFAVQEKERTRIGHELHDNVNQILGTSKLFMDMIKTASRKDANLKEKVTEYILAAIEEIRKLSKEMVTPQLKEKGLIASINTLVADLKATNTMNVLFFHQDEIEMISNGKKVALFRITQEQVKNTLKYSQAKNLSIDLQSIDRNVQLIIQDDGIGFDISQTRRGIGLSNIYERTRFYNGEVTIESSPGHGCKMVITIPLFN